MCSSEGMKGLRNKVSARIECAQPQEKPHDLNAGEREDSQCSQKIYQAPGTKYYVFGLAFSLACPFCNSTVYSTALHPYSFCSCAVFCFTNFLNESRLAGLFSPAFLRASVSAWKSDSTCFWSELASEKEV